ncbi:class I SAM-dependent methyltransferase [Nocardia crassostreae]|uniref:class I SAM-dependent methyltransferase n=1 Tax=Nocardia crassostreae TaxID=53428 RepID=UPI000835CCF5|nr:class I SAM-dependent methyltransferase [Nocardia crassostreae]
MPFTDTLMTQFARPRGPLGSLAGVIMAHRPSSVSRGRWAIDKLAPNRDARVLELGYGPGVTLRETCRRVPEGRIIGVDVSPVMRRQAHRRNRQFVAPGLLELRLGDATALDADLHGFDLIYGINVWQLWEDSTAVIADLSTRLPPDPRPGCHETGQRIRYHSPRPHQYRMDASQISGRPGNGAAPTEFRRTVTAITDNRLSQSRSARSLILCRIIRSLEERNMAVMELARFTVDPSDAEAMLAARPAMLTALREKFDGFVSLRLVRLDERTWLDVVQWRDRAAADAAAAGIGAVPECAAAFAFIKEMVSMEHATVEFADA